MPVTQELVHRDFLATGNKLVLAKVSITSGTAYPTGGLVLGDLGQFGLNTAIKFIAVEQPANGYIYAVDYSSPSAVKLLIYYGNYEQTTPVDGPLIELPNNTSLSATTVKLMVIGV